MNVGYVLIGLCVVLVLLPLAGTRRSGLKSGRSNAAFIQKRLTDRATLASTPINQTKCAASADEAATGESLPR